MKLTVKQILAIFTAHGALDGIKTREMILDPFKLDGAVRSRIARNKNKLKPIIDAAQEAERGLRVQMESEHRKDVVGDDQAAHDERRIARELAVNEEVKKILDQEEDVDLREIDYSALKLDENTGIVASVLEGLGPILKGAPE